VDRLYLAHFGLERAPFSITPDPRFFFPGAGRADLLRAIEYSVRHQEGIVVVTGEVGSGKTMLCRKLLDALPEGLESIYLANPSLRRREITAALLRDLDGRQRPDPLDGLQQALIARYMSGRRVMLVVDEAHVMPYESLEQIRLLSNLETGRHKLLQIVLFGQPELDGVLLDPRMRALRDRVVERFALRALDRALVGDYLAHRMRVAGFAGETPFGPGAVREIWNSAGGLVRRVNLLADKALLSAFVRNHARVDRRDVERARHDLDGAAAAPARAPLGATLAEPLGAMA
jgi:type II secretory pathway predicted ATPase ExeA